MLFKNNPKQKDMQVGTLRLPCSPNRAEGIIFGIDPACGRIVCSPSKSEGHVLVVGGSGTGKTSALLIPTLRRWQGTALVIDISGDIARNVTWIPGKVVIGPSAEKYKQPPDILMGWDPLSEADKALHRHDDD